MGKFSVMDYMNSESMKMAQEELNKPGEIMKVSVFDIEPNEDNFYGIRGIELLKESIVMLGGVQENLILVKNPEGSRYKYKALAGHRRRIACIELVQDGYAEYEYVPADIKSNLTPAIEKGILLLTNSTQRGELTDYEKVMEHIETRKLIEEYKKETGQKGRTRELEAEYLNVSQGQIAIYDKIINNLDQELMAEFERGKLGISAAYEIAKREPDEQSEIAKYLREHDAINESDIKRICGSRIKGQVTTADIPELQPKTETNSNILVPTEDNIEMTVDFIFNECNDKTFPKEKFEKLIEGFRNGSSGYNGYLEQSNTFDNMLPFQNDCVTVYMDCGYCVNFTHTNEIITIGKYLFWRAFEKKYSWMWSNAENKNVTESVTLGESEKAKKEFKQVEQIEEKTQTCEVEHEQIIEDDEEKDIEECLMAAGSQESWYSLEDVREYIGQYEKDYEACINLDMKNTKMYKRTAIILDALKLLEEKIK